MTEYLILNYWTEDCIMVLDSSQVLDIDLENIPDNVESEEQRTQDTDSTKVNNQTKEENKTKHNQPKGRHRRQFKPIDATFLDFIGRFGSRSWSPYLTLKTSTPIDLPTLENAIMRIAPSKEMRIRKASQLEWLIKTSSKYQSETLLGTTNLKGIPVTFTKNEKLNCSYGTTIVPSHLKIDANNHKDIILDTLN